MPIDVNSTAQLLGAFGVIDRPKPFLLDMFFRMEQTFETEEVFFDKVQRARRLAPFVVPTIAGKPERSRGYTTMSFKPPYVKPKHVIEPIKALKRRAGEKLLGGELTLKQRMDLSLLDNMKLEDDEITRREEWMAAQLLLTGMMTCVGDGFPPMLIDLGRNPLHTIALTGSARWGQTGVDPLQNMRAWATTVMNDSGFFPSVVVLDPLAAEMFITAPGVLRVMQTFRQTTGNINLAGAVTGTGDEVSHLGRIGEFDIYQYQQIYTDDQGNPQQLMPPNSVIMGSPGGCQGIRTYGAILDHDALRAMSRFPKVWKQEDPSVSFSMTQSAPLPLLGWVDATFCATVD